MIEEGTSGNENVPLGTCPVCETTVPSTRLLIEYESEGGGSRMFAECPRCEIPVHPA